jgi:hypothetical protein
MMEEDLHGVGLFIAVVAWFLFLSLHFISLKVLGCLSNLSFLYVMFGGTKYKCSF